ncbi:MAG: glycosyltransferase family 2 protein [Hyphomicrobiaceae bacterium]|nr:glycosyltransferase family 2 protein [Hyphomicrobiaceae bacterium]
MPDLTLAITAHSEALVAGPTMHSARAAVERILTAGYTVQLLLGLDNCTDECRAYMTQEAFSDFETHEFAFGDQGKTRNALADLATGHWLAFLDADDLFSENWLIRSIEVLKAAEERGEDAISHPELNWQFDAISNVNSNPADDHPFFSGRVLVTSNYYDAMCVAPRRLWQELRYPDRAVKDGYAFEDYQWFVEATALGWRHLIAPDTIIFKRRRDFSQTYESRSNKVLIRSLEALAIDKAADLTHMAARKLQMRETGKVGDEN